MYRMIDNFLDSSPSPYVTKEQALDFCIEWEDKIIKKFGFKRPEKSYKQLKEEYQNVH